MGESTVLTFLLRSALGPVLGSVFEVKLSAWVTLEDQSAGQGGAKTGTHFETPCQAARVPTNHNLAVNVTPSPGGHLYIFCLLCNEKLHEMV